MLLVLLLVATSVFPIQLGDEAEALTSSPQVTGTYSVGQTLSVDIGTVWDENTSPSIQWLRELLPIPLATSATYELTSLDFAKSINVRLVGLINGVSSVRFSNVAISRVQAGTFTPPLSSAFVAQLSTGMRHTCATQLDGTVQCVGYNGSGQLGDGTLVNRSTPIFVLGVSNAISVSAGGLYSCALINDGTVKCWGTNADPVFPDVIVPTDPFSIPGLSNVIAIDGNCALIFDGTVKCWDLVLNSARLRDVQITGVVSLSTASEAADVGLACALTFVGQVKCWGDNGSRVLSNDSRFKRSAVPVAVSGFEGATRISTSSETACALISGGTIKCKGSNHYNQWGGSALRDVVDISVGWASVCAVFADTTMKCWGYNYAGQLGDGNSTNNENNLSGPVSVSGLTNVVSSYASEVFRCALLSDGAVSCWGANGFGQFALGYFEGETRTPKSATGFGTPQTLTPKPTVEGVFRVGSLLTASPGVWVEGASLTYQWFRNGSPIEGATLRNYRLVGADSRDSPDTLNQITVSVTGRAPTYLPSTQTSSSASVAKGNLVLTPTPSISGNPKVNSFLTVVPGVWDSGVRLDYGWSRDGVDIPFTNRSTYQITPADAGRKISVWVSGNKPGYIGIGKESVPVLIETPDMPIGSNKVSGTVKVGRTITSTALPWVVNAKITYQWLLDGKSIKGATKKSYKLLSSQRGRKISIKVTQVVVGYKTTTSTSVAIRVG